MNGLSIQDSLTAERKRLHHTAYEPVRSEIKKRECIIIICINLVYLQLGLDETLEQAQETRSFYFCHLTEIGFLFLDEN